jgi:toxin ParE1/3/4
VRKWRVVWSEDARRDLDDIVYFIAQEHPRNALKVYERLVKRARSLQSTPLRGRLVPELVGQAEPGLRELIESPWRILYAVAGKTGLVVGVLDGRRDFSRWLTSYGPMDPEESA